MQSNSGAKIHVTKDVIGDDTVIKIFGNQDSIDKAKSLINSLTTDTIEVVKVSDNIQPQAQEQKKVVDWKSLLKECVSYTIGLYRNK